MSNGMKGYTNYKKPQMFGSVFDGKERVEFGGDLVPEIRHIIQKFGIDVELLMNTNMDAPKKSRR